MPCEVHAVHEAVTGGGATNQPFVPSARCHGTTAWRRCAAPAHGGVSLGTRAQPTCVHRAADVLPHQLEVGFQVQQRAVLCSKRRGKRARLNRTALVAPWRTP